MLTINRTEPKLFTFLLIFSITFTYHLDVGFAIKPYMAICGIAAILLIKKLNITKLRNYEILFFVFSIYYCATGLFAKYTEYSFRMILGVCLFLICYLLMRFILTRSNLHVIEKAISSVGILFNTISLTLYVIGYAKLGFIFYGNGIRSLGVLMDRGLPRLIGTFKDPNFFCLTNMIFFFYYLTHLNKKFSKFGLILTITTMMLTLSRGAIIAVFFGIGMMFFSMKLSQKIKTIIIIPVCIFLLNFISVKFFYIDFIQIISQRFSESSADGGSGRFEVWENALSLVGDHPFFGVGIFNWRPYNIQLFGEAGYMHNTFIEVLVESGIVGLAMFGLVFVLMSFDYLRTPKLGIDNRYLFYTLIATIILLNSLSMNYNEMLLFLMALFSRYLNEMNKILAVHNKEKLAA